MNFTIPLIFISMIPNSLKNSYIRTEIKSPFPPTPGDVCSTLHHTQNGCSTSRSVRGRYKKRCLFNLQWFGLWTRAYLKHLLCYRCYIENMDICNRNGMYLIVSTMSRIGAVHSTFFLAVLTMLHICSMFWALH